MKKTLFTIFLLTIIAPWCSAQAPANAINAISHGPDCLGSSVIVRSYGGSQTLLHHVDATNHHIHHFALLGNAQNSGSEVVATLGNNRSTEDTLYSIRDMRIVGDTCYFCGYCTYSNGEPLLDADGHITTPPSFSLGMIGRFSIADIATGSTTVYTAIIPQAERLDRMAVRRHHSTVSSNYDIMISAIGLMQDGSRSSVVETALLPSSAWQTTISWIPTTNYESFTDIVATDYSTLVSSMVSDGAEGSWVANIHESPQGDFYHEYYQSSLYETLISYDFSSLSNNWGWHNLSSPIRMCPTANGNLAFAFATQRTSDGAEGIITAKMSSSSLGRPYLISCGTHASVLELQYLSDSRRLGILLKNTEFVNGCVYSCSNSMSTGSTVFAISKQGIKLQSLSHLSHSLFSASGFSVLTNQLTTLWNNPSFPLRLTCLEFTPKTVEELDWFTTSKVFCDWSGIIVNPDTPWNSVVGQTQPLAIDIECQVEN